jgi:hypothetical protein
MNVSTLKQGQLIDAVFCPLVDGNQSGGAVGYDQVTEIEISQCAGPMGFYDVAIIRRGNSRPDEIVPIHMADYVRLHSDVTE